MAAFLPETDSEDELPGEWEERVTVDGSVYYANHANSSTQWTHPRTGKKKSVSSNMPFGWERVILEDNKVVYVDKINKRTTFTDPRLAFAKEIAGKHDRAFRQKHDGSSTAQHVLHGIDLTGNVALVTGANTGVGYQVVRALALQQCTVVLACRSVNKGESAMDRIKKERPQAQLDVMELDLASFKSVRRFAQLFCMRYNKLNHLVLNAGVYNNAFKCTEDGLEEMMQVNYLSHLYLTQLLLKPLLNTISPRVVTVSAESHRFSSISSKMNQLSDLNFTSSASSFEPILQYNDSKLFCLIFARILHRKFYSKGLCSLSVHPGNLLMTSLHNQSLPCYILSRLLKPFTKSLNQAAASVVMALCSDEEILSGPEPCYINNCFPSQPSALAQDEDFAKELWQQSVTFLERLCGQELSFKF